ncbi:MAG: isoprenyl transferase [Oscillospiraceae bacterium]|nr:isoprenyl transferase [Oscillospiraceae bacterium]
MCLPEHLGIIMDGNGRWAKRKRLPRKVGHTAGANNFRRIVKHCSKIGIKYLTVFAFSTENWKRPKEEVVHLMELFKQYLEEALKDFQDENIKIAFLGERKVLSDDLQNLIEETERVSANCDGMVLNIAMNYGSRNEIVEAAISLIEDVLEKKINICDIDAEALSQRLYTKFCPDPDLIVRTGGEFRISNFLLWQSAYAEYAVVDILWPDLKPDNLDAILLEFSKRKRRFGGI